MKTKNIIILLALLVGLIIGRCSHTPKQSLLPKPDTTITYEYRDTTIIHDTIFKNNVKLKYKYVYLKDTTYITTTDCDTFTREITPLIIDSNFSFFNVNILSKGVIKKFDYSYKLKDQKIRLTTEKITIKEPFPVDIDPRYWKIYAGGILRSEDRFKFNPGVLMTKDRLGLTAGYDFEFKNIYIGVYYLIFKF